MQRKLWAPLLFLLACATQAAERFDGQTWWNTVKVLADDKFEGRETGSPGERQAQEYIVRQLGALGVEPAGSNGFYQPVKLRTLEIQEADSSLALVAHGRAQPLTLGEQAFFSTRIVPAPKLEAALVFAGYGLNIPEKGYNDLAGLDLTGKVAVIFTGSPAEIPSAVHAPSDDTNQPVDLATAAAYEEVIRALTIEVADDPVRPAWKPDSFFRRYAAGASN